MHLSNVPHRHVFWTKQLKSLFPACKDHIHMLDMAMRGLQQVETVTRMWVSENMSQGMREGI